VKPKNRVECKCTSRIAPTGPDWLMYLNERGIADALTDNGTRSPLGRLVGNMDISGFYGRVK
jgi:hypothetical protein